MYQYCGVIDHSRKYTGNEFLKAHFEPDGSVELTDKKTDHVYRGLGIFEDCGDIGNEYIFFAPVNDVPVTTKGTKAEITVDRR